MWFRRIETCPKPVIAAVNGFALAAVCELAMACHIRIASDLAKFGQPRASSAFCPVTGGSQRLPRLVGKGRAMQLLMTGETIDAAEAYRIGLVNKVAPAADLMSVTREMMKTILANGPLAVAPLHRGDRARARDVARRRPHSRGKPFRSARNDRRHA